MNLPAVLREGSAKLTVCDFFFAFNFCGKPGVVIGDKEHMLGTRDRMPANRMMEIPLPIPNSVTCSPIHITKEEPAMKDTIMTSAAQIPVLVRMP